MGKNEFKSEFIKTMTQLATAGFGLVAALAWNDAIQNLINKFISFGGGVLSKVAYAVLVTFIAVWVTYTLGKLSQEVKQEEEGK